MRYNAGRNQAHIVNLTFGFTIMLHTRLIRAYIQTFIRIFLCAVLLQLATPAAALDPGVLLQDYNHTVWTVKDGAPTAIQSLAQTPDGWLWLSTATGLYRFDGVRFERFRPRNRELPRQRIYAIGAEASGGLLVGFFGGGIAAIDRHGDLALLADMDERSSVAASFARDRDGSLWTVSETGVHHQEGGKWRKAGKQDGLPETPARAVLLDQYRQLWISTPAGLFVRRTAGAPFEMAAAAGAVSIAGAGHGGNLSLSPDGRLWLAEATALRAVPNAAPAGGAAQALPRPAWFNQAESRRSGQFDRDGNLWSASCPDGLCIVRGASGRREADAVLDIANAPAERAGRPWQAGPPMVNALLEDREGNVWIATHSGLERFRDNKVLRTSVPGAHGGFSMARSGDGDAGVWMADPRTATAWQFGGAEGAAAAPVAHREQPWLHAANASDGALLLAGLRHIERRHKGTVSRIPYPPGPDGKAMDLHVQGMLDDGAVLWAAFTELGFWGYADGRWLPRSKFNFPPRIYVGTAAGKGQMWLVCADGSIQLYDNGKLTRYDGQAAGYFTGVFVVAAPGAPAGGDALASGDKGLLVLLNGRFRKLAAADPEALSSITGAAATPDGDRWLNGAKGLVHVRAADWRAALASPDLPLRYELLSALDGYPGQASINFRLPTILNDGHGKLWIMTTEGPATLAPQRLRRNGVAPVPYMGRISAGGAEYSAAPGLRLPPGSNSFSIEFAAPSLAQPERVQVQYQLQGVDAGWQDAAARRTAYYTNVGPGAYRFRVRAVNEDGASSGQEAGAAFEIAPTFTQTAWFKALCGLAGAALLYALYRLRLRTETAKVAERLRVRMSERERIARTLHDTVLQSVQALMLRLQSVAAELPGGSGARTRLLAILDLAERTVADGRDQVHELRSGQLGDAQQIAEAIQRATRLQREHHPGVAFSVAADGTAVARALQPQAAEELCAIAIEAVNNAFSHAQGSRIAVRMACGADGVELTVADDGKGMGAARRPGDSLHWGLIGMRERAGRIGARFDIGGADRAGTRVRVQVPAALAYARVQSNP